MRNVLFLVLLGVLLTGPPAPVTADDDTRFIWIPLDSRPVNTDEVVLFGEAAGIRVLLPPLEILDWYAHARSDFRGMLQWLTATSRSGDTQVLYTNNLLAGGMIASRDVTLYGDLNQRLAALRTALTYLPPSRRIAVHVLPRALPTQFHPDGSHNTDSDWGELLVKRSELMHRLAITGDSEQQAHLLELERQIPQLTRQRHDALMQTNEAIVETLLHWVQEGLLSYVVVGLDDNRPTGMPSLLQRQTLRKAAARGIQHRVLGHIGADEIGFLMLAREALEAKGVTAAIHVRYDQPQAPRLVLPYEGSDLSGSFTQKMRFLRAESGPDARQQLFLHTTPAQVNRDTALQTIDQILQAQTMGRAVTIVDVTSPGARDSDFLTALGQRTSLAGMNYSGWNTASNALGTGMAMAALNDLHQQAGASSQQVFSLETFRALRLAYDWLYQSQKQGLSDWARKNSIDPDQFGQARPLMDARLEETVRPEVEALLESVLGSRMVTAEGKVYRICVQSPAVSFRWDRAFEISLNPALTFVDPDRAPQEGHCATKSRR